MKATYPMTAVLLSAAQSWAATPAGSSTSSATTPASGLEEPSAAPTLNAPSVQGCFSSSGPLVFNSSQTFNSKGKCATDICYAMGKPVAGTTSGTDCWCGDKYPPKKTLSGDSNCNIGCTGYPLQACGGTEFWTIYNTGLVLGVQFAPDDSTPSATASSSSGVARPTPAETALVTVSGNTVVVTATSSAEAAANNSGGGGPNTGAIAAGVVVGIVVIASIVGGVIFLMRRRRNQELEEEHRHNAAVNAFINGSKPPGSSGGTSITDARLDPVMTQRRLSDGSIADNQDYSRRILRVTNA